MTCNEVCSKNAASLVMEQLFIILVLLLAVSFGQNACIENLLDGSDSRISPDEHRLGTLANQSLTVTWDDEALANRTLPYETTGTLTVIGSLPPDAIVVLARRSESFRHAGSTTVIQRQIAPVSLTFDRVGSFTISVYMVPDYDSNIDNDECLFYASDTVTYIVEPTANMMEIGEMRAFTQCDLCPDDEQLSVSDAAIFLPSTGVEQTCAGWFQDGINGRLNSQLCDTLQDVEANDSKCSCDPEGFSSFGASGGSRPVLLIVMVGSILLLIT